MYTDPQTVFEFKGYFKEYFIGQKYIGSKICERDRETFGYFGRIEETLSEDLILDNGKKLKAGTVVVTHLQILCGKYKNK